MSVQEMLENHACQLGKVVTNLLSLELKIREFLCLYHREPRALPAEGVSQVPLTHFSNYDSLGKLIGKFNNIVSSKYPEYVVDIKGLDIRDAIAHGRAFGYGGPEEPLRLMKFSRPEKDDTEVVVIEDIRMDEAWFKESRSMIFDQIQKVRSARQAIFNI